MGHIEEQHTGIKNYSFEKFELILVSGGESIRQVGEIHTMHDFAIP